MREGCKAPPLPSPSWPAWIKKEDRHSSDAALIPSASAACPDAEVVFARGRQEPPGVGAVGDALVNSLRSKVGVSVGVYGVNWPADIAVLLVHLKRMGV